MSLFDKDLIKKEPNFDFDPLISNNLIYKGIIHSYQTNISQMKKIQGNLYVDKYGYVYYIID